MEARAQRKEGWTSEPGSPKLRIPAGVDRGGDRMSSKGEFARSSSSSSSGSQPNSPEVAIRNKAPEVLLGGVEGESTVDRSVVRNIDDSLTEPLTKKVAPLLKLPRSGNPGKVQVGGKPPIGGAAGGGGAAGEIGAGGAGGAGGEAAVGDKGGDKGGDKVEGKSSGKVSVWTSALSPMALRNFSTVNELNYLTSIVIKLFERKVPKPDSGSDDTDTEDTDGDDSEGGDTGEDGEEGGEGGKTASQKKVDEEARKEMLRQERAKRYRLEIHFSPGVKEIPVGEAKHPSGQSGGSGGGAGREVSAANSTDSGGGGETKGDGGDGANADTTDTESVVLSLDLGGGNPFKVGHGDEDAGEEDEGEVPTEKVRRPHCIITFSDPCVCGVQ